MSGPQLFTWFHQASRPLSQWLHDHVTRQLLTQASEPCTVAEVDAFIESLDGRVRGAMPPLLGIESVLHAPNVLGGPERPGPTRGQSYSTERWLFEVVMTGDLDLLEWWPDENSPALEPVGRRLEDEPTPAERREQTLADPRADDPSPAFAEFTRDTFLLTAAASLTGQSSGERHVYITVDTTTYERKVHRESGALERAINARVEYFTTMCEAINVQVRAFEEQARDHLHQFALGRRAHLDDSEALLKSLSLGLKWAPQPPTLTDVEEQSDQDEAANEIRSGPAHASAERSKADGTPAPTAALRDGLVAPGGQRLSSASFDDIQRVIAVWAQGVHSYARTFHSLWEDELSCLLTATLKATTPGADHQVYRRAGKTDIIIRAEDLPDGYSNEPVFVCEAKKGGPTLAAAALEDQLLGRYTTGQDTAAVLLLYLTNKDYPKACETALRELRSVEGYAPDDAREAHPVVEGWPVLTYRRRGRLIRVCVAMIDLYFKDPSSGAKKRPKRQTPKA